MANKLAKVEGEGGMIGLYRRVKKLVERHPDAFSAHVIDNSYQTLVVARAILSGGNTPPVQLSASVARIKNTDRIEESVSMVDAARAGHGDASYYRLDVVSGNEIATDYQRMKKLVDEVGDISSEFKQGVETLLQETFRTDVGIGPLSKLSDTYAETEITAKEAIKIIETAKVIQPPPRTRVTLGQVERARQSRKIRLP